MFSIVIPGKRNVLMMNHLKAEELIF